MELSKFGKTGLMLHPLGLGGAEIGYARVSQQDVNKLIGDALDNGCNVIDTAAAYAESEERIGRAITGRRDSVHLFTKVGPEWSSAGMRKDIERSLKRLRTDHVDLLQIWSAPLELLARGEIIETMESFKREGLTRFIGYSGDSHAARYAVETDRFDALQTSISIADQEAIDFTLPQCHKLEMGVIAKRPLANVAWLGGKADYFPGYESEYRRRLKELDYLFLRSGGEEAISTALKFTLSLSGVHTAIVGTRTPGRWQENALILESGLLKEYELEAIRERWSHVANPGWVGQR